jgi:hypothetical protein
MSLPACSRAPPFPLRHCIAVQTNLSLPRQTCEYSCRCWRPLCSDVILFAARVSTRTYVFGLLNQVSQLLLEFLHKYVAEVVSDAALYQEHAGKPDLDIDDLRLAIQVSLSLFL